MATVDSGLAVPSLFKKCIYAVVNSLQHYEDDLSTTPLVIKQACLALMSKRGLITDDNITKVVCNRIRVLDLSACDISDTCLFRLSACRNLYKVDLNAKISNENITSAGIISLSQSCPHLQVLYLRRCINVTDDGVIAVSRNCPSLRELNTGGCVRLTDASLEALGQNSSCLTSVNFSRTDVTDMGVYSLVSGVCSSSLKEVDMSGCQRLTDEAVEGVVQMCPQTRILIFHGCPRITENARVALEGLMHNGNTTMTQITFTVY
ncbi:protein AMN1 homolog [Babylonia areolata]|uniref:protein AMN1 homolog n=1 Tax=Babylonia areolata TaxID=304850 RepID=UPI003FD441C3